jgi:hypothetical protein
MAQIMRPRADRSKAFDLGGVLRAVMTSGRIGMVLSVILGASLTGEGSP